MHAVGVVVAIYFLASALGAKAQVELLTSDDVPAPVPKAHAKKKKRSSASSWFGDSRQRNQLVEQINERNPFCPTCEPQQEAQAENAVLADGTTGPAGQWVKWSDGTILGRLLKPGEPATGLPLRLVATMQAVPADASMATIAHTEQPSVGVFGEGDTVIEGVEIYRVTAGLVHLDNGGKLEYLPLAEPAKRGSRASRRAAKRKKRKARKRRKSKYEIDGARDAIKCDGKTTCTIDRAFVSKLIGNPSLLARQARIRPSRRNGEMRGFKLYGVRRGTLPRLLQLRNGDLLTSINGKALDSMDSGLKLYQQFRNASHLTVQVNRRGKELEMNYDIR